MNNTQDLVIVRKSEIDAIIKKVDSLLDLIELLEKAQPVSGEPIGYVNSDCLSDVIEFNIPCVVFKDKDLRLDTPIYRAPQPVIPSGYALVPVEPTDEMIKALMHEWDSVGCISMYENYEAMLSVVNVDIETTTELKDKRIAELESKLKIAVEALTKLRDCDWVISVPDRMDAVRDIAREALKQIDNVKDE